MVSKVVTESDTSWILLVKAELLLLTVVVRSSTRLPIAVSLVVTVLDKDVILALVSIKRELISEVPGAQTLGELLPTTATRSNIIRSI